jgi:hypothetical protein
MLDKVANRPSSVKNIDVDSDDNWSDDDNKAPVTPKSPMTNPRRDSSGLKKAVSAPPTKSKPPPVSNRGKAPPPRGKVTAPTSDNTSEPANASTSAPTGGDIDDKDSNQINGPTSESKEDVPVETTGKRVTINAGENQRKRTSIFSGMKPIGKPGGSMSNKDTLKAMGFDTPKEVDFHVKEAEKSAKQQLSQLRANERIKDLEAEVFDLQRKLDRSNSRLAQQPGSADALSRETELENELSSATEKLVTQRNINRSLEVTVKELQKRLTQAEHDLLVGGNQHHHHSQTNENMDFNEGQKSRVTLLEEHLVKTKRDKDRAIRVLISILGKDKIASFLDKHAGSPDILDALQQHFMQQKFMLAVDDNSRAMSDSKASGAAPGPKGGMKRKPAKKVKMNTTQNTLGAGRSRMDGYFNTSNLAGYGA